MYLIDVEQLSSALLGLVPYGIAKDEIPAVEDSRKKERFLWKIKTLKVQTLKIIQSEFLNQERILP